MLLPAVNMCSVILVYLEMKGQIDEQTKGVSPIWGACNFSLTGGDGYNFCATWGVRVLGGGVFCDWTKSIAGALGNSVGDI